MTRKTAVYTSPLFLAHLTGRDHAESPDRLRCIYQQLERPEVASQLIFSSFTKAAVSLIQLNHTREHVKEVAATAAHEAFYLDSDTRTSAASYEAALLAAGSVIDGIKRLVHGEIDNGFSLLRPPGHHAERDQSMGYCLFNNCAVGARYALKHCALERILIVDWDLHHGNGTQHSFYRQKNVLYCSLHQFPLYPGSGTLLESGAGAGAGYTVNVPLSGGHGDEHYARVFNTLIAPVTMIYQPQLILVSCGFDLMAGDPVGAMQVTAAGIAYMTRVMVHLAQQVCGGKLLFVLEGGYNLDNMREGALAVLTELRGVPLAGDYPAWLSSEVALCLSSSEAASDSIDQAMAYQKNWWNLG